ncbi:Sugar transporter [Maridesulfovibrio ferrireducens]|uniref:Sugar transporter n=1 Tax=Maridesulfovibrio ferrireducens TaxID=246191 RepID=A0A1G9EGJ4_9BACT|nr:MFS transporter [Maridesulfovibrio ferrireducens]SDK75269.1 Sugar transporter [Maridesulfovibrio ferrireducens]
MSKVDGVDKAVARTVQDYIDETPYWADGTLAPSSPMTAMQWRIWVLASAGKFFEGLVVFMTGVALPLIVREFGLGAFEKGAVSAASLFGILVGAFALGNLADHYGRKRMFIIEMVLFAICLIFLICSTNYTMLVIFLFGVGLALGCDYPTAHMIISESIPSIDRGRLVLSAFAFQAVGALFGTAIGYLILYKNPELGAWRWMYATAIIPAIFVVIGRFHIPDSGHWLVSKGRRKEAEDALMRLLYRKPKYPPFIKLAVPKTTDSNGDKVTPGTYLDLFRGKNIKATILASVPWFIQDLSTYGIGIFTPTILGSVIGATSVYPRNVADLIQNDMIAAKGAAFIDVLLIVGVICAVMLADKVGRIKLQVFGFIGCAAGLFLATLSMGAGPEMKIVYLFSGFMLFSFMTNIGPNAITYLIAGEVFPTKIRGKGAGFAASIAKIGAVITAFFFPFLLKDLGTEIILYFLVGCSLLGAVVTWFFRIETSGMNLEDLE